jgi:hypothetical protein
MAPILVASGFISRAFVEIAKVYLYPSRGQMGQPTKQNKTLNFFFTRDIIHRTHHEQKIIIIRVMIINERMIEKDEDGGIINLRARSFQESISRLFSKFVESSETVQIVLNEFRKAHELEVVERKLDHVAFRTFKGIHDDDNDMKEKKKFIDVKRLFIDELGYRETGDVLEFPQKKLKATWLKPPATKARRRKETTDDDDDNDNKNGVYYWWPRLFISEIDIEAFEDDKMQAIIQKALKANREVDIETNFWNQQRLSFIQTITKEEFEYVRDKSEYASWLLFNGIEFVNHFAISMHRCDSQRFSCKSGEEIFKVKEEIEKLAKLNGAEEKNIVKISEDGLLWQFSTVADELELSNDIGGADDYFIRGGINYIEFAYREFLNDVGLEGAEEGEGEEYRRDGFEVANANGIFDSTTTTRKNYK